MELHKINNSAQRRDLVGSEHPDECAWQKLLKHIPKPFMFAQERVAAAFDKGTVYSSKSYHPGTEMQSKEFGGSHPRYKSLLFEKQFVLVGTGC